MIGVVVCLAEEARGPGQEIRKIHRAWMESISLLPRSRRLV
jgi:hypothetical protein